MKSLLAVRKKKKTKTILSALTYIHIKSSQHNKNFKDLYTKVNFTYYLQISQERHHFLCTKSSTTFTQMFLAIPQRSEKQADLLLASQLQGLNLLLS